jgi:hypothetical protein
LSYFIFPEKIKALFGSSHTIADSTVIATTTNISETDSALIEQIKSDLIGKEVLSWNAIKPKEIKELTISSVSEIDKNSNYIIAVQLDDNAGTKAITELLLSYNKIILANVTTTKITYKNTAPTNAWFSFEPIANCRILVNTNNNPIQLKTCDNCEVQKINTNAENALKLVTQPTKYLYLPILNLMQKLILLIYQQNKKTMKKYITISLLILATLRLHKKEKQYQKKL